MYYAQLKVKGDDAAAQCSTRSALLNFLCDAVVGTDSEFFLADNSQDLAALLSLGHQNLEGVSLFDFMPPFEAQKAVEMVGAAWGNMQILRS